MSRSKGLNQQMKVMLLSSDQDESPSRYSLQKPIRHYKNNNALDKILNSGFNEYKNIDNK